MIGEPGYKIERYTLVHTNSTIKQRLLLLKGVADARYKLVALWKIVFLQAQ